MAVLSFEIIDECAVKQAEAIIKRIILPFAVKLSNLKKFKIEREDKNGHTIFW